jgi:hypothetical protein
MSASQRLLPICTRLVPAAGLLAGVLFKPQPAFVFSVEGSPIALICSAAFQE